MVFDHPLDALRDAAARAKDDPFYLSGLLEAYRQMENMSQNELASYLGCLPDLLPSIALCRRPHHSRFRQDIEQIASRFTISPDRLANLVRAAEAYQASGAAKSRRRPKQEAALFYLSTLSPAGDLMAARDREEEPPQPPEEPEKAQE